jgi:thiosulfate/3-mercaptopyruvate sulfurtransferase
VNTCVVSTEWLAERLEAPDIVILDASWHLPPSKRDGHAEYLAEHIPRALFFDIDEIADTETPCPTCCRRRRNSPRACARWASATART